MVVLILRLAQAMYSDSSNEVLLILDLFSRIVTFNMVIAAIRYKYIYIKFFLGVFFSTMAYRSMIKVDLFDIVF